MASHAKNEKQLVNEYCQREKHPNPVYMCTPDKVMGANGFNTNGFFCTLTIGSQSFCTTELITTKKLAVLEAAKMAVQKYSLTAESGDAAKQAANAAFANAAFAANAANGVKMENGSPAKMTAVRNIAKSTAPILTKEADWITIEKVEDIYQYLTDEVLAQEFKAFLHCKAQEDKTTYPVFITSEVGEKGFTSTVTYDDKQYKSIGIMLSKKQAEQSASEKCLRSIGDFPAVSEDKYTIQPYRGGRTAMPKNKNSNSSNPSKKYVPALLQFIVSGTGLRPPQYFTKVIDGSPPSRQAAVLLEGKVFESSVCEHPHQAKNSAATEALKYLGITDLEQASEFKDKLRVRRGRYPYMPFTFGPSKREQFMFYHYELLDKFDGADLDYTALEGIIDLNLRRPGDETIGSVLDEIFSLPPSLSGKLLSATADLSVAEIDNEDKNLMTVGNQEYSIKLYCEGGKIHCEGRGCEREILAGHNIRGLKCSYKVTLPALQVYLKAESCDDLFYPNPALPVVTTCGAALLMYDHEANVQDLHILLTRPSSNRSFLSKAMTLRSYLNKLIGATPLIKFNVSECVASINSWSHNEIKLLSEMTMDSMLELLSPYVTYDDRWNEVFAKEHPDGLKGLKDAATVELKRREEEGTPEGDEEPLGEWKLPSAPFRHRFAATGVMGESSLMCAFHSLSQATGLRVLLSELEASPHVDLSADDNPNVHRGDVHRYYLWKGLREGGTEAEEETKGTPLRPDILEKLGDGWIQDETKKGRDRRERAKDRVLKRKADGSEVEDEKKSAEGEKSEDVSADAKKMEITEEEGAGVKKTESEITDVTTRVPFDAVKDGKVECPVLCQWFTLEEAKQVCPVLTRIAKTKQFQSQVKQLQMDANAFVKTKANLS